MVLNRTLKLLSNIAVCCFRRHGSLFIFRLDINLWIPRPSQKPDGGRLVLGPSVSLGYLEQTAVTGSEQTVWEEVRSAWHSAAALCWPCVLHRRPSVHAPLTAVSAIYFGGELYPLLSLSEHEAEP